GGGSYGRGGTRGPGGGGGGGGGGSSTKGSPSSPGRSPKGRHRSSSHGKNLNRAGRGGGGGGSGVKSQPPPPKEGRSPQEGRHTPENWNLEGQVLFATPNQRRSAPVAPYTDPSRRIRQHQNLSPNYNRMRSPEHHAGGYSKSGGSGGGGYYGKGQGQQNKQHSKLPHGLTVQELKEMTRARLAAEAEVGGPDGSSDQSVHSTGGSTHGSSKASDQFSLGRAPPVLAQSNEPVTRNLVRSNEALRRGNPQPFAPRGQDPRSQMSQQQQQQQHRPTSHSPYDNFPQRPSPVIAAGPPPNQYHGNQPPPPGQRSPAFGLSSSLTVPQGETWDTASAASAGGTMLFPSPDAHRGATFNRARCFSAGATTGVRTSSFDHRRQGPPAAYFDGAAAAAPLGGTATGNRQRCATVSPPGMSRLHEDRPFLFSSEEKERLAVPPLSEPRLRLHSTGGLSARGAAPRGAFDARVSPPPSSSSSSGAGGSGSGSAFVPVGGGAGADREDPFPPQSPPPAATVDRSKFRAADRTISSGSAVSLGHGDIPSSMAEAVLASITSAAGGGGAAGRPFAPSPESPFHPSADPGGASSAFRLDALLARGAGGTSLFSGSESRHIFPPENSGGDRLLLGTHSWGGAEDDFSQPDVPGLSHDFGNVLNLSGDNLPALRGRAATEPAWFGGNELPFVSRIDPEHDGDRGRGPPRVSSLVDTNAYSGFNDGGPQGRKSGSG
ncbi:hypothetical protein ACHAWF_007078, partial [Thalassiosira exigua]